MWADNRSVDLTHAFLRAYRDQRNKTPPVDAPTHIGVEIEPPVQPVAPRPIQEEALEALTATRAEGFARGLVVMATGLGKTWLAAFDTTRPEFRRTLFIAHREEILRQSRDVFRRVQASLNARIDSRSRSRRWDSPNPAHTPTHRHHRRYAGGNGTLKPGWSFTDSSSQGLPAKSGRFLPY